MRQLPVDFSRAIEIHQRCEDEGELVRAASERVRSAKRRVQDAQAEIDMFAEDYGPEIGTEHRASGTPFRPGLAGHNLRKQELEDAQKMLAAANERYHASVAEASYWSGLKSQVMGHLRKLFPDERQLPVELRTSEEI